MGMPGSIGSNLVGQQLCVGGILVGQGSIGRTLWANRGI